MNVKLGFLGWLVLALVMALAGSLVPSAQAAPLAASIVVVNANDSGTGSLRQAILDATSGDAITFSGDFTIKLVTELAVNKSLIIDGSGHTVTLSGDTDSDGVGEVRVLNIASGASVTLNTLSIVKGYVSAANGGGILNAGTFTLLNSTVSGNETTEMGGGLATSGAVTVKNSTFTGNTAQKYGGAIYVDGSGPVNIVNASISGNNAILGGALYRAAGTVIVTNTLVANSPTGGNCYGAITNGGSNLDSGTTCGFGALNGSISGVDPLLASLGNYGGYTQTLALLPGSPALDLGDDSVCGSELGSLDQRGNSRLSSGCDTGAYESQGFTLIKSGGDGQTAPISTAFALPLQANLSETGGNPLPGAVITFTAPSSDASATWSTGTTTTSTTNNLGFATTTQLTANEVMGSYEVTASVNGGTPSVVFGLTNGCSANVIVTSASDNSASSLRQALVNVCEGGAISFGGDYTIRLTSRLVISKNLSINGTGHVVTLSGDTDSNGTGDTSLLLVDNGVTATLNRLILVDGRVTTGGGLWNNGTLTINNSTLTNNSATTDDGGAVYNTGTLTVTNSLFATNSAVGDGGGIYNTGTLNVTNSTFSGNSAANGGGIANAGTSVLMVLNSTFSGNSATSGGGIYKGSGMVTVTNTILAASVSGGNCSETVANGGYNIDDGSTCGFGSTNNSMSNTDPLLVALASNGGPTQTFALQAASPALDAAGAANCPAADQRGVARPQGSGCDIGAFELKQFSISGNAGRADVTLSYVSGIARTVKAASDGRYVLYVPVHWTGTVTPSLVNYVFIPESRSYTNVIANKVNQNYTAKRSYIISGNVGMPGVTLSYYVEGTAKSVTSASNGAYKIIIPTGWSGTVTPTIKGYTFTPLSITYTNVTANKTGQNYTPAINYYTISGNVGTVGVTLSYFEGTDKTATSDAKGNYNFKVPYKWTGTVTPSKLGWTFTPTDYTFPEVTTNTVYNFEAHHITFTVSGTISGITGNSYGALLHYTDETYKTIQANLDGTYTLEVTYGWTGDITPSYPGYTFTPGFLHYDNVLAPIAGRDYAAAVLDSPHIISGVVSGDMTDKTQVVLTYVDDLSKTAQTIPVNSDGEYSITVPYNWAGTVTPSLTGYVFNPAKIVYQPVTTDWNDQNFVGYAPLTFKSIGAQDGWVLESSEISGKGGTFNSISSTFSLGDDTLKRQYRAILSFDTSTLPANAILKSAVLRIRQYGVPVGTNPFTVLGTLRVAIRKGLFGNAALEVTDFQARANSNWVATFSPSPVSLWYSANLNAVGLNNINRTGLTQFRLYFSKDDNNDLLANYMNFVSGNRPATAPQLIIYYVLP